MRWSRWLEGEWSFISSDTADKLLQRQRIALGNLGSCASDAITASTNDGIESQKSRA